MAESCGNQEREILENGQKHWFGNTPGQGVEHGQMLIICTLSGVNRVRLLHYFRCDPPVTFQLFIVRNFCSL